MKVLEGTKLIIRYMDLYTRPPVNIAGIEIPSKFIKYFVFFSMIVTTIPIGIYSYVNIDNFKVASAGILYFMANSSIKLIYFELVPKRKHIIDAIDNMEQLITKRKTTMNSKMFFCFAHFNNYYCLKIRCPNKPIIRGALWEGRSGQ